MTNVIKALLGIAVCVVGAVGLSQVGAVGAWLVGHLLGFPGSFAGGFAHYWTENFVDLAKEHPALWVAIVFVHAGTCSLALCVIAIVLRALWHVVLTMRDLGDTVIGLRHGKRR